MSRYRFDELSAFEFEALTRDLLQEELDTALELFTPGPDAGVDVRRLVAAEGSWVVQCKRWQQDAWRSLYAHLETEEVEKVQALAPERYMLATSVQLNPDRKNKLVELFAPFVQSASDIFGRDDLTGLLARHPTVERRHIKLWLTSTEVLDAILHSDIAVRSEDAVQRAERQLRLWVPNPSFERAQEILEDKRVCILSGTPGIGKTMLADVLLAAYVSRGYEPVLISEDIGEGDRLWRAGVPQFFHYDDFLGHVTLGELTLRKNEPSRLASFVRRVLETDGKRLLLTTREYILKEALNRYEALGRENLDTYQYIVSLSDYTRLVRAEILYNHLFFSELSQDLRTALLDGQAYLKVISHRNYSPRIIEQLVQMASDSMESPESFVNSMLDALDNPSLVWQRIYENLPAPARSVLQAMSSLPWRVLSEDLYSAAQALAPATLDAISFALALRMLEGTFISTHMARRSSRSDDRGPTVRLKDPSVRDYLNSRLWMAPLEFNELLASAVFFEQLGVIAAATSADVSSPSGRLRSSDALAARAVDLLQSPSPVLVEYHDDAGGPLPRLERETPSIERRTAFIAEVIRDRGRTQAAVLALAESAALAKRRWQAGQGKKSDAVALLRDLRASPALDDEEITAMEDTAFDWIVDDLSDMNAYRPLVDLAVACPRLFQPPHRTLEDFIPDFQSTLRDEEVWFTSDCSDPDLLESEMYEAGRIAEDMGTTADWLIEGARSHLESLWEEQHEEVDDEGDWRPTGDHEGGADPDDEIEAMFESLRGG